ncbi:hypothetical protein [Teredinibacter turnerae]|uniref:hypothetical protein n=1 Tax=Teredinibacter turnerae TaxID=2426 RepID=UPI001E5135B3|nr:hypothetical protein [Teredinibacter turnerae]
MTARPPSKLRLSTIKRALLAHYSAPMQEMFKQFRSGAIFFAVGLTMVYLANTALLPSLRQELVTLAGLILAGAGFVVAMLAQIRMIISRFLRFLRKP